MQTQRSGGVKNYLAISSILALGLATSLTRAAPPATSALTPPAPNWYNVELIVFRATDTGTGSLETWPLDPGTPDWNAAAQLLPPDSIGPAVPYQALSPVNEQLDDTWTRLKRSKNYEPLLHVTWIQPALDRPTAQAVRIGVPPSAAPSGTTHMPAFIAGNVPLQGTPVYGDAKLSTTGPYLHFDLDLVLLGPPARISSPPVDTVAINTAVLAPPAGTAAIILAAPVFQLYRLQQDRRVDGGKLSYFDHPLFGAILLVTPVHHSAAVTPP
jgi:hypothetical protein